MDKIVICIPTYVSVSSSLFNQWIQLAKWCTEKNIEIITISNRTHNDARNWLATGGGGFQNPTNLINEVDWLIWIDSDQFFTKNNLQTLIDCDEKFCCGWYVKDTAPMVAKWDEDKFLKNGHMDFLTSEELEESKEELIEVDYCGFGFTKTHVSLFKELTYPFFRNEMVTIGDYQENVSEDATFCLYVNKYANIKPKVITDLKIGHLKEVII